MGIRTGLGGSSGGASGSITLEQAKDAEPASYFFDAVAGDDGNDGRTRFRPKRTVAAHNCLTLAAGDSVFFKAGYGQYFNDTNLIVSVAGVTYDSYAATGKVQPVIGGVQNVIGTAADWSDQGYGRWKRTGIGRPALTSIALQSLVALAAGETVTGASSGATGVVDHVVQGNGRIYVVLTGTTGIFAVDEQLNGSASGASCARILQNAILNGVAANPGPMGRPGRMLYTPLGSTVRGRAGLRAGQLADMGVDIKSVASSLSFGFVYSQTISFAANRRPFFASVNGQAATYTKEAASDLAANGEIFGLGASAVSVYSASGTGAAKAPEPPATNASITSLWVSAPFFASTITSGQYDLDVFSPQGNPALYLSELLTAQVIDYGIHVRAGGCTLRNLCLAGMGAEANLHFGAGNITDTLVENCHIWGAEERGIRLYNGCHRLTVKSCRVDDNGTTGGGQTGDGIAIGTAFTDYIEGTRLLDSTFDGNATDGVVVNSAPGSRAKAQNCKARRNGENPLDVKNNSEFESDNCIWRSTNYEQQGGGNDATSAQGFTKLISQYSEHSRRRGQWNLASSGGHGLKRSPRAVVQVTGGLIFSDTQSAYGAGNDNDVSARRESGSVFTATEFVATAANHAYAVGLYSGDDTFRHCNIHMRNTSANMDAVQKIASLLCPNRTSLIENSILVTEGGNTASRVYARERGSGLTGDVDRLVNNIYFSRSSSTWMKGDATPTNYTEAQVDADIALGAYFAVTTDDTTGSDRTRDPLWNCPHKGGPNGYLPDGEDGRLYVGDRGVNGDLYILNCASIATAPVLGERMIGATSGAVVWVRDVFNDGGVTRLLVQVESGTPAVDEVFVGDWASKATMAASAALVGPLQLRYIDWDFQDNAFSTLGQIVTGGTSGHTGYLVYSTASGASGYMVVATAQTFADDDALTGEIEGARTLNGTATQSVAIDVFPALQPRVIMDIERVNFRSWRLACASGNRLRATDATDVLDLRNAGNTAPGTGGLAANDKTGTYFTTAQFNATIDAKVLRVASHTDTSITSSVDLGADVSTPDSDAILEFYGMVPAGARALALAA